MFFPCWRLEWVGLVYMGVEFHLLVPWYDLICRDSKQLIWRRKFVVVMLEPTNMSNAVNYKFENNIIWQWISYPVRRTWVECVSEHGAEVHIWAQEGTSRMRRRERHNEKLHKNHEGDRKMGMRCVWHVACRERWQLLLEYLNKTYYFKKIWGILLKWILMKQIMTIDCIHMVWDRDLWRAPVNPAILNEKPKISWLVDGILVTERALLPADLGSGCCRAAVLCNVRVSTEVM